MNTVLRPEFWQYSHIGGQVASQRQQLENQKKDKREFGDINNRHKEQLIKVKVRYLFFDNARIEWEWLMSRMSLLL